MATLSDLLVSYKQVEAPTYNSIPELPMDRFDRLQQYINNRDNKDNISTEETIQDKGFAGWYYKPDTKGTSGRSISGGGTASAVGSKAFNQAFNQYTTTHQVDPQTRQVLTNIAEMESRFNSNAANSRSSARGWFQFLDGTRKQLGNTQSRQDFMNDTQGQINLAVNFYRRNNAQLEQYKDKIAKLGLTPTQAAYGMWWRPASMINYLRTGSDSYQTSDGMTLEKILKKAGKYKA